MRIWYNIYIVAKSGSTNANLAIRILCAQQQHGACGNDRSRREQGEGTSATVSVIRVIHKHNIYTHIYIILILAYCNTQANNMRNIKGLYVMYPHAWYKTLTSHPNFILMRPAVWAQAGPVAQQTNATRTAT